jgi:glycosyltransferase involved in cell wall biosynthesis
MKRPKPDIGIFMARPDRTYYMAGKLRELGFEVVHYNTHGYQDDCFVRVNPSFLRALFHLLARTDHAVYFTSLSFIPSLCLYVNRLLRGRPYVFNFTGVKWEMFRDRARQRLFSGFWQRRLYPFLLNRVFAGASKIVCNSRFLEQYVSSLSPRYHSKLVTVYNGIEFQRYASGERKPIPGVNAGETTILCVTALNFENKSKGVQMVLDAFEGVLAKRRNVKLVIAAKAADQRYTRALETNLQHRRCRRGVVIFYNRRDIPDLLASSDVFIYATPANSNDSLPRALLEAQSAGLPVVTTRTTGCAEIVLDGKTGFVVSYDPEEMTERILRLVDNPTLRREMGKQAQEWILQRFSWDQMAAAYARIFLEVGGPEPATRQTELQLESTNEEKT